MSDDPSSALDPEDLEEADLGVSKRVMMPCLHCMTTQRFTASSIDKEDKVVIYRCSECQRRIMVEL